MTTDQADAATIIETEEPSTAARKAARDAAIAVIEKLRESAEPPGQLTLSNGIVLRIKSPPQNLLREAAAKVPKPKVPVYMNEDKGREEENPLDPDYLLAIDEWESAQALAVSDIALLLGTECLSVPADMYGPADDEWIDYLRILGLEELADVPPMKEGKPVPPRRYWAWLRLYAHRTQEDIAASIYATMSLCSLTEEEVALAVASFRSIARRRSNLGGGNEELSQDGDPISGELSGDSAGDRGEGSGALLPDLVAEMEEAAARG